MKEQNMQIIYEKIAPQFAFEGKLTEAVPYGSGHINEAGKGYFNRH